MSAVDTLITGLKARIAVCAPDYSELGFVNNIEKNSFKGNIKRIGVKPLSAREVSSVNRFVTIDQEFEIILTDGFINTEHSDESERAAAKNLIDLARVIYIDAVNTKAGAPNTCILVSGFNSSEPESLSGQPAIILRARFTVKYRSAL